MNTARNASDCVGKQPIMVATAMAEHSYWLRLRFLRFSFTQRTQRKRLRLGGNRALVDVRAVVVSKTQPVAVSTCTVTYRPQELQPNKIGIAVIPSTLKMPSSMVSKCRITLSLSGNKRKHISIVRKKRIMLQKSQSSRNHRKSVLLFIMQQF